MALRVIISFLISFVNNIEERASLVVIINDLAYEFFPLIEFISLASRLPRFNHRFEIYARQLNMRVTDELINCVRRLNWLCVFFIVIQFSLTAGMTLTLFGEPRNWMVKRTFPVETPLGPLVENIIGHLSIVYETFVKNYIPLSVSLYLCYYRILIGIKRKVLSHITHSTSCECIHERMKELNDFINLYEATFSILPLAWLTYSIGPGLSYALYFLLKSGNWAFSLRKIAFFFRVLWNFTAVLLALYFIGLWQGNIDKDADSLVWDVEMSIRSTFQSRTLDRVTCVMRRKVTVWETCPIDKMLILSFIGSALTFSVFFLQLSS